MTQGKGPIIIGAIIFVAFIWGYRREYLYSGWRNVTSKLSSPSDAQDKKSEKRPLPPEKGDATNLYKGNPYATMGGGAPRNPGRRKRDGSLADTLDSIRPGQVGNQGGARRNSYFEKLSQQLKALQGDSPNGNSTGSAIPGAVRPKNALTNPPAPEPRVPEPAPAQQQEPEPLDEADEFDVYEDELDELDRLSDEVEQEVVQDAADIYRQLLESEGYPG